MITPPSSPDGRDFERSASIVSRRSVMGAAAGASVSGNFMPPAMAQDLAPLPTGVVFLRLMQETAIMENLLMAAAAYEKGLADVEVVIDRSELQQFPKSILKAAKLDTNLLIEGTPVWSAAQRLTKGSEVAAQGQGPLNAAEIEDKVLV